MSDKTVETKGYVLPIFGEVEIKLHNEAKFIFKEFEKDILRLREIPHLGIIHETYGIPVYTRYDHVILMMALIEETTKNLSHPKLTTSLKLSNSVEYSSIEEFLKAWSMLYPIGHFYTTFTAEHAFMRHLLRNNSFKEDFKKEIDTEIKKHFGCNPENNTADEMINKVNKIISSGDVMRVHTIFTLLRILYHLNNLQTKPEHSEDYEKIKELTAFIFLRDRYLDTIKKVDQRTKLRTIIEYFKLLRMLAFIILDGAFAPSYVRLDPLRVVSDIEKFVIGRDYRELLYNIQRFYTATLYHNKRNMYYHHLSVRTLENNIFPPIESPKKLIEEFLAGELDNKIKEEINKLLQKHIPDAYDIVVFDIPMDAIPNPITWELQNIPKLLEAFGDKDIAVGGIMTNLSNRTHRVSLFVPNSTPITISSNNLVEFLQHFLEEVRSCQLLSPLAGYLLEKLIGRDLLFPESKVGEFCYPLVFPKDKFGDVLKRLAKLPLPKEDKGKQAEYNCSLSILNAIKDMDDSEFFVYTPNMYIVEKNKVLQEIDFLLTGISKDKITMYLAEIKSNSNFKSNQLIQELGFVFNPHPKYELNVKPLKVNLSQNTENCTPQKFKLFEGTITLSSTGE